jgi:hypothetical protein
MPQPTREPASSTKTFFPLRASSPAIAKPTIPAPITKYSTSTLSIIALL